MPFLVARSTPGTCAVSPKTSTGFRAKFEAIRRLQHAMGGDAVSLLNRLYANDSSLKALPVNTALLTVPFVSTSAAAAAASGSCSSDATTGEIPALCEALLAHRYLRSLEISPEAFHAVARRSAATDVDMERTRVWRLFLQACYHLPLSALSLSGVADAVEAGGSQEKKQQQQSHLLLSEADLFHVLELVAHLSGVQQFGHPILPGNAVDAGVGVSAASIVFGPCRTAAAASHGGSISSGGLPPLHYSNEASGGGFPAAALAMISGGRGSDTVAYASVIPLGSCANNYSLVGGTSATQSMGGGSARCGSAGSRGWGGTLLYLDLRGCCMTPALAARLGDILAHPSCTLRRVDLQQCSLGDDGLRALLVVVPRSTALSVNRHAIKTKESEEVVEKPSQGQSSDSCASARVNISTGVDQHVQRGHSPARDDAGEEREEGPSAPSWRIPTASSTGSGGFMAAAEARKGSDAPAVRTFPALQELSLRWNGFTPQSDALLMSLITRHHQQGACDALEMRSTDVFCDYEGSASCPPKFLPQQQPSSSTSRLPLPPCPLRLSLEGNRLSTAVYKQYECQKREIAAEDEAEAEFENAARGKQSERQQQQRLQYRTSNSNAATFNNNITNTMSQCGTAKPEAGMSSFISSRLRTRIHFTPTINGPSPFSGVAAAGLSGTVNATGTPRHYQIISSSGAASPILSSMSFSAPSPTASMTVSSFSQTRCWRKSGEGGGGKRRATLHRGTNMLSTLMLQLDMAREDEQRRAAAVRLRTGAAKKRWLRDRRAQQQSQHSAGSNNNNRSNMTEEQQQQQSSSASVFDPYRMLRFLAGIREHQGIIELKERKKKC